LIGSHALSLNLTLVTNDKAFAHMEGLEIEDWAS
jgi:predicted nucleic acid-binding protein